MNKTQFLLWRSSDSYLMIFKQLLIVDPSSSHSGRGWKDFLEEVTYLSQTRKIKK